MVDVIGRRFEKVKKGHRFENLKKGPRSEVQMSLDVEIGYGFEDWMSIRDWTLI